MSSFDGMGDCMLDGRSSGKDGTGREQGKLVTACGDAGRAGPEVEASVSFGEIGSLKLDDSPTSDDTHSNVQTLNCNGFLIEASPSQRKYLGGVASAGPDTPEPGLNCELYCGRLPKDVLENELIPLFAKFGEIWDLRLLMNATSYKNRGYAFVKFTNPESAKNAMAALNNHVLRPGTKGFQIEFCKPRVRLFVGNIPKAKSKDELFTEFSRRTRGLKDVIIYKAPEDKKNNRGFCFLEYDNHANAFSAKKLLGIPFAKVWGCEIIVDWADPIEEPEDEIMEQVKVLYVRNLTSRVHEDMLRDLFSTYGAVERVKRIKDFAFVHYDLRENAERALKELNGLEFHGSRMEVTWAKPPVDNQRKEDVLRARERRMTEMQRMQNSQSLFLCPPIQPYIRLAPVSVSSGHMYADHAYEYGEMPYDYEYDHNYYHHPTRYAEEAAYFDDENVNEYAIHVPVVVDSHYGHGCHPYEPQTKPVGRPVGRPPLPPSAGRGGSRGSRRPNFTQPKEFVRSEMVDHDENWRGNAGRTIVEQLPPSAARAAPGSAVVPGNGRRSRSWKRRP